MAEAILAFGLASNAIQFIDFGSKILSKTYHLYHSKAGGQIEECGLEVVTRDLQRVTESLQSSFADERKQSPKPLSQNEVQLQDLARRCQDSCSELVAALEELKVHGRSRRWNTFRAALKTVWSEDRIDSLQRNLDNYRQELIIHILLALREQASKPTETQVPQLKNRKKKDSSPGEVFLAYIQENKRWQRDYMTECKQWQEDLIKAIYHDGVDNSHPPVTPQHVQRGFIDQFQFYEIDDRHSKIAEAYENTFQWIYQDPSIEDKPWANFSDWLRGESPVYWITGKAGSGKSTLMKYIQQDERTLKGLHVWAAESHLVTAAFYFWNSGADIQMSQLGLFQTILYQVLNKRPSLIAQLFPERWEAYRLFRDEGQPWTCHELQQALKKLCKEDTDSSVKYCFFIDGLDEFDGDHTQLINLLKSLARVKHIKLCVSSRPWVVFEDALECTPGLMVQDLTHDDIQHYVSSNFRQHEGFAELEQREPAYASVLMDAIVQKAAGVFLWVNLVVTSLLNGLGNADRVQDLQRRLDSLPPELENLFQKMLDSLDPFYLEHASELIQLVRASPDRRALFLSYGDDTLDTVLSQKIQPLSLREQGSRIDVMRRRLSSRCKGLLELDYPSVSHDSRAILALFSRFSQPTAILNTKVQYLHRTVKDFVESKDVWEWLLAASHQPYDANLALCKAYVMDFKLMRDDSLQEADTTNFWTAVGSCIRYAREASIKLDNLSEREKLFPLLDELDPIGSKRIPEGAGEWNFLSLMVKADMRSYVRAKVESGCLIQRKSGVWPLLNDACLQDPNIQRHLQVEFPSPEMILLLLEKGADPNARLPKSKGTVWTLIRKSEALDPEDLDILTCLLAPNSNTRLFSPRQGNPIKLFRTLVRRTRSDTT